MSSVAGWIVSLISHKRNCVPAFVRKSGVSVKWIIKRGTESSGAIGSHCSQVILIVIYVIDFSLCLLVFQQSIKSTFQLLWSVTNSSLSPPSGRQHLCDCKMRPLRICHKRICQQLHVGPVPRVAEILCEILSVWLDSRLSCSLTLKLPVLHITFHQCWYVTLTSSVIITSGGWAQPEAPRCGRGTAAEAEREAAFLRRGVPARRGRLPILGTPLYPRLQETWVGLVAHVFPHEYTLTHRCTSFSPLSLSCSSNWQHLVHGGERGLAGPNGANWHLWSGDFGCLLQLWGRRGADLPTTR